MITVNCTGLPASHIESEQRLKRVFHIHFETCAHCHGLVKIIAAIDDPEVSHKILTHLAEKASANPCEHFPERRAPAPALGVICDSAASLSEAAGQGATTPAPNRPCRHEPTCSGQRTYAAGRSPRRVCGSSRKGRGRERITMSDDRSVSGEGAFILPILLPRTIRVLTF